MNFRDLIHRHRKTEPTSVLVMRRIFIIILPAALIAYIVFLGLGIHNETPSTITSHIESFQSTLAPSNKIIYLLTVTVFIKS